MMTANSRPVWITDEVCFVFRFKKKKKVQGYSPAAERDTSLGLEIPHPRSHVKAKVPSSLMETSNMEVRAGLANR